MERPLPVSPNDRYNRWQGLAIAQLSVAVALVSALSVAGLGTGLSLLQNKEFMQALSYGWVFVAAFVLLLGAAVFSCATVISRTLDFRLTARRVRGDKIPNYDRSLTVFSHDANFYGRATWFFFWVSCLCLLLGAASLVAAITTVYTKCFT